MHPAADADHTIVLNDIITCYELCSNDFAYNLLCVAKKDYLSLIVISMPEESEEFMWKILDSIKINEQDSHCHALAFSPLTSLNSNPNKVTICAAIGRDMIKVFHTDLAETRSVENLRGHRDYVNDVAWICDGEMIASVSDDFTCKLWDITSELKNVVVTFNLSSAGVSVQGHPEDPHKILVAEKRGIIHLFNVRSKQTVISVESPKFPLMSAEWAIGNRLFVTALAGGDIVTWDLSRPLMPVDVKQVHEDGGTIVRFAPGSTELAMASIGRPDYTLKVFVAKSAVPLMEASLKSYGGLAWHHRLPYISAASDRKLCFWKVQVK